MPVLFYESRYAGKKEDFDLLNNVEEDIGAWEANAGVLSESSPPITSTYASQITETGKDGAGDLWDLDQILSTNLFTFWG